ncbi:hypothetical protein ACFE04_027066 [Oxalis oulophora]
MTSVVDITGHSISSSFLFWSLCLISPGPGAYNPSLQALGTYQLENDEASLPSTTTKDEKISNTKRFAIPTGGMIATTLVFSCWRRIYASRNDVVVDKKMIMQNFIQSIKAIASKLCSRKITQSNEKEAVELELQEKPLCVGKNSINIEAKNEEKNPKTEKLLDGKYKSNSTPFADIDSATSICSDFPTTINFLHDYAEANRELLQGPTCHVTKRYDSLDYG